MTRGLKHATFNRAGLVRILSETLPTPVNFQYDFGERLGQWLDFQDALNLFSVLNTSTGTPSLAPENAASPQANGLQAQLARLRKQLGESIRNDGVFNGEAVKIRFPTPLPEATPASASDYAPYHRYYLAHQRDMSNAIAALRNQARKALADRSPAHRQLAEIDAAFEKVLTMRERNLLANIPILLAQRFKQRYAEHCAQLAQDGDESASSADNNSPASWAQPGGWLQAFCQDAQAVLLAELELRLKLVSGLIAALGQGEPLTMSEQ